MFFSTKYKYAFLVASFLTFCTLAEASTYCPGASPYPGSLFMDECHSKEQLQWAFGPVLEKSADHLF